MKRFVSIRNPQTAAFYSNGRWTESPEEATLFDNATSAVAVCLEKKLEAAELVMLFEGEPRDVLRGRTGIQVS